MAGKGRAHPSSSKASRNRSRPGGSRSGEPTTSTRSRAGRSPTAAGSFDSRVPPVPDALSWARPGGRHRGVGGRRPAGSDHGDDERESRLAAGVPLRAELSGRVGDRRVEAEAEQSEQGEADERSHHDEHDATRTPPVAGPRRPRRGGVGGIEQVGPRGLGRWGGAREGERGSPVRAGDRVGRRHDADVAPPAGRGAGVEEGCARGAPHGADPTALSRTCPPARRAQVSRTTAGECRKNVSTSRS